MPPLPQPGPRVEEGETVTVLLVDTVWVPMARLQRG